MRRLFHIVAAAALFPGAAFAHASLVRSDPADEAKLAAAPPAFTLTFNEPVSPTALRLVEPDGAVLPLADFHLEGETVVIRAPAALPRGTQTLSWRVISADGHPVGGSLVFAIGAPGGAGTGGAPETGAATLVAVAVARFTMLAALLFGVGGSFFDAFFPSAAVRRVRAPSASLTAGALAALAAIGLQGVDAGGDALSAFFAAAAWREGFATSLSGSALFALAALTLAALSYRAPQTAAARAFAALSLVSLGASFAATGHASTAEPQPAMRLVVFLHAGLAALWLGALAGLRAAPAPGADGARALRRFSDAAAWLVPALVALGFAIAAVQMPDLGALLATAYGRLLSIKLALVAAMLALAALNRRATKSAPSGDAAAARGLRRRIGAELALAVALVAVVTGWRFTPPPRAMAAAAAASLSIHVHGEKAMAQLTLASGRVGRSGVAVRLYGPDAAPLAAKEVRLGFSQPGAGIEPIERTATLGADGSWRVDGLDLPFAGTWNVDVAILVDDFTLLRIDGKLTLKP